MSDSDLDPDLNPDSDSVVNSLNSLVNDILIVGNNGIEVTTDPLTNTISIDSAIPDGLTQADADQRYVQSTSLQSWALVANSSAINAGMVLASPVNGVGNPTFRSLESSDLATIAGGSSNQNGLILKLRNYLFTGSVNTALSLPTLTVDFDPFNYFNLTSQLITVDTAGIYALSIYGILLSTITSQQTFTIFSTDLNIEIRTFFLGNGTISGSRLVNLMVGSTIKLKFFSSHQPLRIENLEISLVKVLDT